MDFKNIKRIGIVLIVVAVIVAGIYSCKTVNTLSNNDDLEKEVKSEELLDNQGEFYKKFIEMLNNVFEGDFRVDIIEHDADSVVKAIHSYKKGDSIIIKNGEKILLENIKKD